MQPMFCLTPVPPHAFDRLIDRTTHNRAMMKRRGQLQPLIVPSPEQRADGLWREQIFLAADAVIAAALDLLVEAGAARAVVGYAMKDLQLEIVARLNDIDDGKQVHLVFAHDGSRWAVLSTESIIDALKVVADHFADADPATIAKVAFFTAPLHQAATIVRKRAAQHDIEFPDRIWLTREELDAGVLLAAAIAPRTSPVIEQWQIMRQRRQLGGRHRPICGKAKKLHRMRNAPQPPHRNAVSTAPETAQII
jgi:hypothetical protein